MIKEQEAIDRLHKRLKDNEDYKSTQVWLSDDVWAVKTVLSMLKEKDVEIEKLKKHNKDLLRKLRNRVKEIKKLNKYSLYKKEFANLNKRLEMKNKMIDEISKNPYNTLTVNGIIFGGTDIKQYFEKKVEEK